jgi:hypothetical protein
MIQKLIDLRIMPVIAHIKTQLKRKIGKDL